MAGVAAFMSIRSEDTQPLVVYCLSLAFGTEHFPGSFYSLIVGGNMSTSLCVYASPSSYVCSKSCILHRLSLFTATLHGSQ